MGHTKPPFTMQFKVERGRFSQFRRALLVAADKLAFDDLWNRAEFHVPAADKAAHPLPVATILMMINLEQEKTILALETKLQDHRQQIKRLAQANKQRELQTAYLQSRLEAVEKEMEARLKAFREEILEIKYEYERYP